MSNQANIPPPTAPSADQLKSFAPSVSTKNFQYIATKGKGKGSQGLFSMRRPKDVTSGFSSGLKNIGKGLGAGLGAIVAGPIAGYKESGWGGLAKGTAMVSIPSDTESNVAVIIVRIVFIGSFLFYCLLLNHSFPTNPNRITNCFKLILLYCNFTNYICSMRSRYFDF